MKKRITLTLDLPDDERLDLIPTEITARDWIARGILVLALEASTVSSEATQD